MRVVYIGTGDIGLPVLHWLQGNIEHELAGVVTQPDKPVGRAQRIEPTPIKAAVMDAAIPVLQPERIKRDQAVADIRELAPDVIVVMAYGQILPRAVLDIPRLACLNLHASLLPRHRGAAPIQAAIVAGDAETGITVISMDEGLDTGDMLLQTRLKIAPDETGGSLHDRLAGVAAESLHEALTLLAHGNAPRVPQKDTEVTYAPKLEREHGFLDWSQSAEAIERKIRAFDPWPGAYTILRDPAGKERKLKLFRAQVTSAPGYGHGQILARPNEGLMLTAQDGALLLDDVQIEGKKRMPASDLLRGNVWIADASVVQPATSSEL